MKNRLIPVHPGKILKDELSELKLSATAFAKSLKIPTNRVTSILNGERSISADTAIRLARFFGNTPEFWMNLQIAYDIKITLKEAGKRIRQEVHFHKVA
jgi:addiction module HigA family antidote